ncbi:hypothetical protein BDZ91DRAFT_760749 [Kalaharituber pfeilii]|nr:hypothetical protein BDZ91DRAFT_760749 [Kalaharituber pfeilii]
MDARTMQNYELGSELLPPILLPLTVTSPIFMAPMAIALRPSMQGEMVPAPSSHYPQMVNSPMPECLPDANQDSFESDGSASFDIQNPQPILNAAAAASQQSQVMSWMSPNVPHNFVPAPSLPEYAIRFEPATFAPPPLRESHRSLKLDAPVELSVPIGGNVLAAK